jgi:hypothetical protein
MNRDRTPAHRVQSTMESGEAQRKDGQTVGRTLLPQIISKKRRLLFWMFTIWAIVIGCFVTDLFVCPWTAVFQEPFFSSKKLP